MASEQAPGTYKLKILLTPPVYLAFPPPFVEIRFV